MKQSEIPFQIVNWAKQKIGNVRLWKVRQKGSVGESARKRGTGNTAGDDEEGEVVFAGTRRMALEECGAVFAKPLRREIHKLGGVGVFCRASGTYVALARTLRRIITQ